MKIGRLLRPHTICMHIEYSTKTAKCGYKIAKTMEKPTQEADFCIYYRSVHNELFYYIVYILIYLYFVSLLFRR